MIATQTVKPDIRCSRPTTISRTLAALSLAVVGVGLAACSTHSAGRSPTPSVSIPVGSASSTQPAHSPPPSSTPPAQPASFELGYQPLYPFASLADAQAWQAAHRSGGHQPWHGDAGATAISFTWGWLGFNEIDTVTSTRTGLDGAHIGVGYRDPNGGLRTAAVLHLVRFGNDPDSPWEVVGSDDGPTNFSLDTPAYGSPVTSPITVGGHIVGVDENIKVTVHRLANQAAVGSYCCTPAGPATPTGADWRATVSFTGSAGDVLTIVAQTGGHLQRVERFAIQGVHS